MRLSTRIEILTKLKEGSLTRGKAHEGLADDRWLDAIHQAAHAVVIVWLGGWLRGVEFEGVGYGERDRTEYCFRADRYTEETHVCIAWVGWLSEMRYVGEKDVRHPDEDLIAAIEAVRDDRNAPRPSELADDETALLRILSRRPDASDVEIIRLYRRYENLATGILEEPGIWDAILAVANKLTREGVLTCDDVAECLEEHVFADVAFLGFTECRRALGSKTATRS